MSKSLKYILLFVVLTVFIVGALFIVNYIKPSSEDEEIIKIQSLTAIELFKDGGNTGFSDKVFPSSLTDEEKQEAETEYVEKLKKTFAESSQIYGKLVSSRHSFLHGTSEYQNGIVEDTIFEYELSKIKIQGEKAELVVSFKYGQKYITENYKGTISAIFPIGIEDVKISLEKFDKYEWKVVAYQIINYKFDGDVEQEKAFRTVEEARDYSVTVSPKNIYAEEKLSPNSPNRDHYNTK